MLMMPRLVHILLVFSVSLTVVMAGVLGGNVLCVGNDGHIAIEPPHQIPVALRTASPSLTGQQAPLNEHGPCSDITVNVEVAVRQTAIGTVDSPPIIIPPVLDATLLAVPAAVAGLARLSDHSDAAQPPTTLGCLRCTVLLI